MGLKLLISWIVNVVCLEVIDMNCKECYRWWVGDLCNEFNMYVVVR